MNTTHDDFSTEEYQRKFRNQATGIGQTRSASEGTGARRSQCVIDAAPAEQRKSAVGYPVPTPDDLGLLCPGGSMPLQTSLKRATP